MSLRRGSNALMQVVFTHPEPIDPSRARWVAIVRSLAAVAELQPVTWFTPDSNQRVREYAGDHLSLALPDSLTIETLPSVHKRMGLTINRVFFSAFRKSVVKSGADVLWLRSDKLAAHTAHKLPNVAPLVYEAHLVGELYAQDKGAKDRKLKRAAELERFRLGVSTNYELLQAQNQLTTARLSELRALIDHINAIAEFERVQTIGN